jgi:hypothetical protein
MFEFSKEETETIIKMQAFSGLSMRESENLFRAFLRSAYLSYIEGSDFVIPLLGLLKFDVDSSKVEFIPSKSLRDSIQAFLDGESGIVEQELFGNIKNQLRRKLDIND